MVGQKVLVGCLAWLAGWPLSAGTLCPPPHPDWKAERGWGAPGQQPVYGSRSVLLKLGARKSCSPCVYRPSPPVGTAEPEAQAAA